MIPLKLQHGYSREISRAFVTIYELPMNLNVQQRATLTQFHSKDQWAFVCLHMGLPIDHHNLCDIIYNYMLHSNTTSYGYIQNPQPIEPPNITKVLVMGENLLHYGITLLYVGLFIRRRFFIHSKGNPFHWVLKDFIFTQQFRMSHLDGSTVLHCF